MFAENIFRGLPIMQQICFGELRIPANHVLEITCGDFRFPGNRLWDVSFFGKSLAGFFFFGKSRVGICVFGKSLVGGCVFRKITCGDLRFSEHRLRDFSCFGKSLEGLFWAV